MGNDVKVEVKDKIIKVIKDIFNEEGWDGVTAEAIANRTEISKESVCSEFGSRELAMFEVLKSLLGNMEDTMNEVLEKSREYESENIYIDINNTVSMWVENRKLITLLVIKLMKDPEYSSEVYDVIRNFYNKFAKIKGVTDYKDDNTEAEEQIRTLLFSGIPMLMYPFFVNCLTNGYDLSEEEVREIFLNNFVEVLNEGSKEKDLLA